MLLCEKCDKPFEANVGGASLRFCSSKCSHSRVFSEESKQKKRLALQGKPSMKRTLEIKEKWRKSISATHKLKHEIRALELLNLPFEELSVREKRKRILIEQDFKCSECKNPMLWNEKPLTFDLDHVSGSRADNSRSNLRLVCPNCHSQTPTYKTKNYSKVRVSDEVFCKALGESDSIYKALEKLGINRHGGNYTRARKLIVKFNLGVKL